MTVRLNDVGGGRQGREFNAEQIGIVLIMVWD